MTATVQKWPVLRAIAGGAWRDHPGRIALAVLGIALGVALGVAVHLINASAANEFNLAIRSLSGDADVVIRGARGGFPDELYARIASLEAVRAASPAVEVDAQLAGARETIKIIGLDPFRAAEVQPHLLAETREALLELLKGEGVLLSRSAADELKLKTGDSLRIHGGSGVVVLPVIEVLPAGATRQRLAIIDIAGAQWRLGRVNELHRVDVKLVAGTDIERFRDSVAPLLPPGVLASTPDNEAERSASFTRAYRTNLDMLALVSLFTGAFLVFSTQFLALLRRRTQLALLRVVGLTRERMLRFLALEGALIGVAGSALGVALGVALARFGLERVGGDLGGGYFRSVAPELALSPAAVVTYFALGLAFAVLGALVPAIEASRRPPALALKAGDEEFALRRIGGMRPGAALLVLGLAASQAPPVLELPLFGYLSVALMLVGTILLMPSVAEIVLSAVPLPRYPPAALATAQLQATPRQAGVSLAAIVASFSLMVSMLIMIGSFRASVDAWLDAMLPADMYVRAGRLGDSGFFTKAEQERIAKAKGVREAIVARTQNVLLRADRPPLTLLARPYANGAPLPALPIEGRHTLGDAGGLPTAWLSEIAADLLRVGVGDTVDLPLGTSRRTFKVAGIWRDYARQNGAIVIDRDVYMEATGDDRVNEAALYLTSGSSFDAVAREVRAAFAHPEALEIASTRELKEVSLSIFDRTFAITYGLEAAAVLIGLFGVSTSFSAQALARRREFGVLRHLGMRRWDIGAMLACEGVLVGGIGVAVGLGLGWLISLVLVHVINRQSFHWSMDMHLPWAPLATLSVVLIAAATLTAVLSGRRAMSDHAARAVREDW